MGMVKIIYYADPMKPATESVECNTVADFLLSKFSTRDQLLDLRFFDEEILGHEIDQTAGDFLSIDSGTVAITHDSMLPRGPLVWVYVVIAVVFAATVILLKPKIPDLNGSNDQQSGTNRLGDSRNEPRINQRIDDIFGTVTKHTPPLWQVPYRIGINNQEAEILYLCIGRGKYQIPTDKWYDGDTPVINIPGAKVNIYGPGTHPGNGSPSTVIGGTITEKIGIYRQSNDLNPSELAPPNELENAGIVWRLSGSGGNAVLTAVSLPDGFSITDFYKVGDQLTLNGMNYVTASSTVELFYTDGIINGTTTNPDNISASGSSSVTVDIPAGAISVTIEGETYESTAGSASGSGSVTVTIPSDVIQTEAGGDLKYGRTFQTVTEPVDLSQGGTLMYTVISRTSTTLTLDIPSDAPAPVVSAWAAMSNYSPVPATYRVTSLASLDVYVVDRDITNNRWLHKSGTTYYDVNVASNLYRISAGVAFNNIVGPIFTPPGATEILLNFVSASGFYKLKENNEVKITANIKVTIYELDSNGNETGLSQVQNISYSSNPTSARQSVFKTARLVLPYVRSKVTAERTTNRDKDDNISNVDIIEWRDFYSFEPVDVTDFGDVTTAQVVIPSNSQSRLVKERKQKCDPTRLVTQYLGNGNFGPTESYATDQFDQILIHTMLDPVIGRMSLSNINADGFLDLRDEIESYFGSDEMCRFGYDFDTTSLTAQDTFFTICDAVMCVPYHQAGVYDAFFEKKQTVSTMQVTCRNKLPGSETRKKVYDRKNDGVEITFRNNETGASEVVYIPQDQSSLNPERITLNGCTSKLQAFRYGSRIYNKQLNQITFVKFDVDEFGRNIIPGKRLDSPDSTRFTKRAGVTDGYRVYDGEVVEVNGLEVELSEPVEFTEGEDHYIVFTKENGDNTESILCTRVNDFTVLLGSMPSEPIYDGYSRDRTKFTFTSEQLRHSVALLPQTIEFNLADDGSEVNTVSCTNYSDKFYDGDLEFPL